MFRVYKGLGFGVSCLGFRVSSLGFRVSSLGFRVPCLRFRASSLGFRVSCLAFRLSSFGFRVSCLGFVRSWIEGSWSCGLRLLGLHLLLQFCSRRLSSLCLLFFIFFEQLVMITTGISTKGIYIYIYYTYIYIWLLEVLLLLLRGQSLWERSGKVNADLFTGERSSQHVSEVLPHCRRFRV